jgi:cell division protein FtsQ
MRRVKPAKSLESAKFLLLKRRIQKNLPRHPMRYLAALAGVTALGLFGLGTADLFDHGGRLQKVTLATTAALGLTVQDVEVQGRAMTSADDVLKSLNTARGAPILAISPEHARQQLEALPWIRSASVERILPGRVFIHLVERKPLAIWQRNGKMALIDTDGVTVTTEHLERYSDLLLVVGDDAPKNAQALIDVLKTQPDLMKRVTAAVWVGERRWNLQMDNGIEVQLPESGLADAWNHLAEIEKSHSLLARDIAMVDMRLADRVVVKAVPEPAKPGAAKSAKPVKQSAKAT